MALEPCICGFRSSMLKVVVFDRTFLIKKYKGTLIVATCQKLKYIVLSPCLSIVDFEKDGLRNWFFTKLKEVTCDTKDLLVISDQHQSIINEVVYQNGQHGHCIYHIKGNLRTITRKNQDFPTL